MAVLATRVSVLGKEWTVWFLPEKEFRKRFGGSNLAVTETTDKEIYLRAKKLSFETTAHELTHAYLDELCLTPATDLSIEALEEIFCDMVGRHGRILVSQAHDILESFLALKSKAK